MLAKLLQLIPAGHPYCEHYAGGASLLFGLKPRKVEMLNDLNGDIVNFFRVLQGPEQFEEFKHRAEWTPYAVEEFQRALDMPKDASPVDRAWAFFVRSNQGFLGTARSRGNWSRDTSVTRAGMAHACNSWIQRLRFLSTYHKRLLRVQIDCRDAIDSLRWWNSPQTVHYIDPPYVESTRSSRNQYTHECDDAHHAELVAALLEIEGKVVVSGYHHPIYQPLVDAGWHLVEFERFTSSSNPRTEVVWRSPNCQQQQTLFD